MPLPTLNKLPPEPDFNDLVRKINSLVSELTNLLLNLDDVNFDKITANVINVNELSAISANLGTITAGIIRGIQIYGSLIATSEGTYPRSEMSNTARQFGSYSTANRYVKVEANPNLLGAPMANFGFDGAETWITQVGNTLFIVGQGASQINIGGSNTTISGPFNLASHVNFGVLSVPGATDPDEAVTSINVLIGYLSLMGILA